MSVGPAEEPTVVKRKVNKSAVGTPPREVSSKDPLTRSFKTALGAVMAGVKPIRTSSVNHAGTIARCDSSIFEFVNYSPTRYRHDILDFSRTHFTQVTPHDALLIMKMFNLSELDSQVHFAW